MIGPEITIEASVASAGGAAGTEATGVDGTGAASVTAGGPFFESSPQPKVSRAAAIATASSQLRIHFLRSISTIPPSSRSLSKTKGRAAERKRRLRDTSQLAPSLFLPCRPESRHRRWGDRRGQKTRASHEGARPWGSQWQRRHEKCG